AGTALHDQHLVDGGPDHDVLLGLDRRHDLAHRTGAGGADLGEHRVGDAAGHVLGVGIVEMLVEVGRDVVGTAVGGVEGEAAAQRDVERVGAGGAVERGG